MSLPQSRSPLGVYTRSQLGVKTGSSDEWFLALRQPDSGGSGGGYYLFPYNTSLKPDGSHLDYVYSGSGSSTSTLVFDGPHTHPMCPWGGTAVSKEIFAFNKVDDVYYAYKLYDPNCPEPGGFDYNQISCYCEAGYSTSVGSSMCTSAFDLKDVREIAEAGRTTLWNFSDSDRDEAIFANLMGYDENLFDTQTEGGPWRGVFCMANGWIECLRPDNAVPAEDGSHLMFPGPILTTPDWRDSIPGGYSGNVSVRAYNSAFSHKIYRVDQSAKDKAGYLTNPMEFVKGFSGSVGIGGWWFHAIRFGTPPPGPPGEKYQDYFTNQSSWYGTHRISTEAAAVTLGRWFSSGPINVGSYSRLGPAETILGSKITASASFTFNYGPAAYSLNVSLSKTGNSHSQTVMGGMFGDKSGNIVHPPCCPWYTASVSTTIYEDDLEYYESSNGQLRRWGFNLVATSTTPDYYIPRPGTNHWWFTTNPASLVTKNQGLDAGYYSRTAYFVKLTSTSSTTTTGPLFTFGPPAKAWWFVRANVGSMAPDPDRPEPTNPTWPNGQSPSPKRTFDSQSGSGSGGNYVIQAGAWYKVRRESGITAADSTGSYITYG